MLLLALLISLAALPQWPSTPANAADSGTDTGLPVRTAQEVAAMWRSNMSPKADVGKPFVTPPSVTAPYAAGVLRGDYVQDGVNAVNFYRYIAGLPADVAASDDLNGKAAHGAVLLASEGNFGHMPPSPADMPKDFYDIGYDSTSHANIFASFGYNNHILFSSIEAYMEDSDSENLAVLGHRRWLLNPPLQRIGAGLAKGKDEFTYSALQVFDKSRSEKVNFHYIPYPARGAFPIEVMKPETAWSVSLNRDEFLTPTLESVHVKLTRQRDNRSWLLDFGSNYAAGSGAYFNVEKSNYGTGPAVIFRPNGVDAYRTGDRYEVVIEGLKAKDGSDRPIRYTVDFTSAANPETPKFSDMGSHWAAQSVNWAFDKGIASGYPDGTFRPNREITEAEFLKMFTVSMGGVVEPSAKWSDTYYAFAAARGFAIRGLTDAAAQSKPLSRTAVAELFASGAGQRLTGDAAVKYMLDNGYSKGKTAATIAGYAGSDTLTRAEAVQFIKNALDAGYALPSANA